MKKRTKPQIAVIGLGAFGMALVKTLGREGANVIAVDTNMDHLDEVKHLTRDTICFDATDVRQLRNHGITEVDKAVIAIGKTFEPVVIIAMELLKSGVREVYARAATETQEEILKRIGVTEVIHPERQVGERMGISLNRNGMRDLLELGDGFSILEIEVPNSMLNYSIVELKLRERYGINVLTIRRPSQGEGETESILKTLGIPEPTTKFLSGDRIVVFGKKSDCDKLLELH
ncbi:TrkA-N domain protein [Desulfurispirillum indicum S5]|uniref:TrkA-N domain protein n=1 Tax=Desulfurispirillum indicum (strain ATCC BAA-1389 / DSM 22839 / S5) TaxID=653733 RepID=E6W6S4_DESIS|nr:TrkA family potassium uptake protein [Desulfurispirillum indicum]ADU65074.1 TrkA-N domain protein [Desulfurispirillum indicum S5]